MPTVRIQYNGDRWIVTSESGGTTIKDGFLTAKSAKHWVKGNCTGKSQANCEQRTGGHSIVVEQEDYDNLKQIGRR